MSNPVGREAVEDGVDKRDDVLRRLRDALEKLAQPTALAEAIATSKLIAEADALLAPKGLTVADVKRGQWFCYDGDEVQCLRTDIALGTRGAAVTREGLSLILPFGETPATLLPAPSGVDVAAVERECAVLASDCGGFSGDVRIGLRVGYLRDRIAAIRAALGVKA